MGQAPVKEIRKERQQAGQYQPRIKEEPSARKQIIRLFNVDIDSSMNIAHALMQIRGIGFGISNAICNTLLLNKNTRLGELKPEQIKEIEHAIADISNYAPAWLLNRRKDPETGENLHLVTNDLSFRQEMDIKIMKKIKCYKGIRHAQGLPARGQRTKAHFRKGRAVGVLKKAVKR